MSWWVHPKFGRERSSANSHMTSSGLILLKSKPCKTKKSAPSTSTFSKETSLILKFLSVVSNLTVSTVIVGL